MIAEIVNKAKKLKQYNSQIKCFYYFAHASDKFILHKDCASKVPKVLNPSHTSFSVKTETMHTCNL